MNIAILTMNAWDHAIWVYSKGFMLRGLIVGLLSSLPLALLLEIVKLISRRVVNVWHAMVFIIVFYGLELSVNRYGASSDTGFLGFIDNIWLQALLGYGMSVVGAILVLVMTLVIFGKKPGKSNAMDHF
ncbi:MAG: hypothetical protein NVV72_01625 [Asticcacaulis sp.]|nr:hypothetical protein [Asticcacaulis sp.]